jgi:MFS superfamily sulfate permease-like transporter
MNDRKYWMKRRRYGWGWTPTTWQAWVFILFQLAILFLATLELPFRPAQPSLGQLLNFLAIVLLIILSLVMFGLQTAPRPRWRWGKKSSDDPNEDF